MIDRQQFSRPSCFPFPQQPRNKQVSIEQILQTPTLAAVTRNEFITNTKVNSKSPTDQIHMIKSIKTRKKSSKNIDQSTVKKKKQYFPMIDDRYFPKKRIRLLHEMNNKSDIIIPKQYILRQNSGYGDNSLGSYLKKNKLKERKQYLIDHPQKSRKRLSLNYGKNGQVSYSHKELQRPLYNYPSLQKEKSGKSKFTFTSLKTQFNRDRQTFFSIFHQSRQLNNVLGRSQVRIPVIPKKQQLSSFLMNYKTSNQDIQMKTLLKKNFCAIEYSKQELFVGQMIGKHKNGTGILITKKSCFQGEWRNNQRVKGIEITQKGVYKGTYVKDLRDGSGQYHRHAGDIYVGEWKEGKKHGIGLWINQHGDSYNGNWIQGRAEERTYKGWFVNFKQSGFGKETFKNGDYFEGIYKNDLPDGKGFYRWKDGGIFEGNFYQGMREGWGQLKINSQIIYCGQFSGDKPEGDCQIYVRNKPVWEGIARRGELKGNKNQGEKARGAASMLNMREGRYY